MVLSLFVLSSCASKSVRDEDLKSWPGQSTQSLESHPVFSALPREERAIPQSDDVLINYYQKKATEVEPRSCFGTGIGFGGIGLGANRCSPRQVQESACTHQFRVKNNVVQSYRVLGDDCYTDCKFRPNQTCPDKKK